MVLWQRAKVKPMRILKIPSTKDKINLRYMLIDNSVVNIISANNKHCNKLYTSCRYIILWCCCFSSIKFKIFLQHRFTISLYKTNNSFNVNWIIINKLMIAWHKTLNWFCHWRSYHLHSRSYNIIESLHNEDKTLCIECIKSI
jgi:hypothetical protein